MAKFVPGPLIQDIWGRVGSIVFTSYMGIGVVKSMPTHVYNPNSIAQQDARASASYISQQWQTLTDEQQAGWEEEADDEESLKREREQC